MADKNPIEAGLAVKVHKAEEAVGKALAAPASETRIQKIAEAQNKLIEAEDAYSRCQRGTGYPLR